ncbi:MAG: hypothetical protein WBC04_26500 [Candidatus Acidiferrales bacterium]
MAPMVSRKQPSVIPNWKAFEFLIGDWFGEGWGAPGQGTGTFSFTTDLQGRVLIRRDHSDYPATEDRPALSHDSFTVIYVDSETSHTRATYFDNEGHSIQYAVTISVDGKTATFLSDLLPSRPRFRLTYTNTRPGELELKFEIAPPDQPEQFIEYVEATARKKAPARAIHWTDFNSRSETA